MEVVQLDIFTYRFNRLKYLIDRYQIHKDVGQIQKSPLNRLKYLQAIIQIIEGDYRRKRRITTLCDKIEIILNIFIWKHL